MGRYIKTVTGNEWRMLTHEQHPILSLPKRLADIREKDTVLFYQKKMKKAGGLVVGAGIVERVIPVSLNERGRIGPPRALLRFWAENIGMQMMSFTDLTNWGIMNSQIIRWGPFWIGFGPSPSSSTLKQQAPGQTFK